ncbi:MAG: YciI family protein [Sulfitobacter sp.]
MLIALIAHDRPGALQVRMDTRADHVAYLKSSDAVQQAGPLLDAEGQMIGSLIVLDVATMAAAEEWAKNDPYAHAGLFAEVQLIHWNRVIG